MLIGMMGSGKSTVGALVAARLGRPFIDSDREIERRTDASVSELFAERGEPSFRAVEAETLAALLADGAASVVAAGGGAVIDPGTRQRMRDHGVVVWLRAEPATLIERVGTGEGRPLLASDAVDTLSRLAAERAPLYEQTAHCTIDVDGLTPAQVAERVLASFAEVAA